MHCRCCHFDEILVTSGGLHWNMTNSSSQLTEILSKWLHFRFTRDENFVKKKFLFSAWVKCVSAFHFTGIGCSLGAPPSIVIVQQYFNKRRALAAGLSACGMSIAALGGPALYRVFLSSYGWRGAFLLHGGMCLHGVVLSGAYRPLPTRKRIRNSHMTSGAPSGELTTSRTERCVQGCLQHFDLALLKDKQFVLYCCGNFFGNYGLVAFYVHFVNCAVYKGVDKKEATLLPIIMGSTALISKLIFSFVSNLKCVNRTLEYSVGTLLCGLIIGFTYPVMAFAGLCAIAAAFGIFTSKYCIRTYPQITAKLGWEYRGFNRCHMRPTFNDDVIKWKHFPRHWPFVRGIHRSPVNSPHKGQWRGGLMFSLICAWTNGCVNNRDVGDLRRHRAHYDVIVMATNFIKALWAYNWNFTKNPVVVLLIPMTKSCHTFAYVTAAKFPWHVQNYDVI